MLSCTPFKEMNEFENYYTDDNSEDAKSIKKKIVSFNKAENSSSLNKKRKNKKEILSDTKYFTFEKNESHNINIKWNDCIYVGCEDDSIKVIKISTESITKRLLGY